MEFRWVIFLTLWTILSGPVFSGLAVQVTSFASTARVEATRDAATRIDPLRSRR
jgi:hypothetical protein